MPASFAIATEADAAKITALRLAATEHFAPAGAGGCYARCGYPRFSMAVNNRSKSLISL